MMAGMTDYTGVSMDTILAHLVNWRDETQKAIEALTKARNETEKNRDDLDQADDIVEYIDYFVDLFGRYCADFPRLLAELPQGVTQAHVENGPADLRQ
jgi:hypothetical protein